ncbi:MAG TPA: hypothetical protein VHL14_07465, partial [Steroidobacteraceae bacterium]|nr:hypothetical protein [Steroidobacteraceae bacterium]
MNPVLQELLAQLKQRQITLADFKADLQGLCKMSPSMIPSACNMLETAVAKGEVPPEVARELITQLNPAYMQPAKTLLRRDAPTMTSAPNDATVVMGPSSTSSAPAAPAYDATAVMNAPEATVAMTPSTSTAYEATAIINKPSATATPASAPDKTVVMNAPTNAAPSSSFEKTMPMQSSNVAEEATRLTQPRSPAQPSTQMPEGTMQRVNE